MGSPEGIQGLLGDGLPVQWGVGQDGGKELAQKQVSGAPGGKSGGCEGWWQLGRPWVDCGLHWPHSKCLVPIFPCPWTLGIPLAFTPYSEEDMQGRLGSWMGGKVTPPSPGELDYLGCVASVSPTHRTSACFSPRHPSHTFAGEVRGGVQGHKLLKMLTFRTDRPQDTNNAL